MGVEYGHLRIFGVTRIAGGLVATAAGIVCLWYGIHGRAALFLLVATLNLGRGYGYVTIALSASGRN